VTNILAIKQVAEKHRITYDSNKERACSVHYPHGIVKDRETENGLHVQESSKLEVNMLQPVDENKKFYTKRQIAEAKTARDFYAKMGTPSIKDYKLMMNSNMLRNCPITTESIDWAETIFGPDIGCLKGKTTRKKAEPVVSDYVTIPPELMLAQREITLCIDGLTVNG
jgi:hypothetical protein